MDRTMHIHHMNHMGAQENTGIYGGADLAQTYDSTLDAETVLNIASDVQIINERKYRFRTTPYIHAWPLRSLPHQSGGITGTIGRACVVTAVAQNREWLKVRVRGGKEGWMQRRLNDGSVILEECTSYRRHEEWGGHNRFFLGGHVMLGSDVRWFICSNVTLSLPMIWFLYSVCLRFPTAGGVILARAGATLWVIAMLSLWVTALTDPGIIPANPSNARALPPEGEAIGLHGFKYCDTCNIFRPPRSKHCHACNNCVDRFDHHCPWVGSCVAVRNYRYFLLFVSATVLLIGYMLVVNIARVILRVVKMGDGSVPKAIEIVASGPLDLIMVFVALVIGVPLFRLWWYHVQTILARGETTNEDMRGVYREHPNEYNKGFWGNSYTLLCASRPRSRLPDLTEIVNVGDAGNLGMGAGLHAEESRWNCCFGRRGVNSSAAGSARRSAMGTAGLAGRVEASEGMAEPGASALAASRSMDDAAAIKLLSKESTPALTPAPTDPHSRTEYRAIDATGDGRLVSRGGGDGASMSGAVSSSRRASKDGAERRRALIEGSAYKREGHAPEAEMGGSTATLNGNRGVSMWSLRPERYHAERGGHGGERPDSDWGMRVGSARGGHPLTVRDQGVRAVDSLTGLPYTDYPYPPELAGGAKLPMRHKSDMAAAVRSSGKGRPEAGVADTEDGLRGDIGPAFKEYPDSSPQSMRIPKSSNRLWGNNGNRHGSSSGESLLVTSASSSAVSGLAPMVDGVDAAGGVSGSTVKHGATSLRDRARAFFWWGNGTRRTAGFYGAISNDDILGVDGKGERLTDEVPPHPSRERKDDLECTEGEDHTAVGLGSDAFKAGSSYRTVPTGGKTPRNQ